MKELTTEQKAQRYDEAIKKLYEIITMDNKPVPPKEIGAYLFPELVESEDEKIRKAIHIYLDWLDGRKDYAPKGEYTIRDMIAWLEKQDEHANFRNKIEIGDKVTRNEDGVLVNLSQLNRVAKKQGEQKHVPDWMPKFLDELRSKKNYFDWDEHKDIEGQILAIIKWMNPNYFNGKDGEHKSAAKFHEGDWIIHQGTENIYQVVAVIDNQYQLKYGDNYTIQYCADVDRCARLWDITKDAKDGDVLVCKGDIKNSNGIKYERICLFKNLDNAFFTLTKTSNYVEEYDIDATIDYPDNTVPATKEQKEILFMAMKEAGYEWDAEKKELKKIESYSLRSIIKDKPSPTIKKVVDSLTTLGKEDKKIEQAYNVETQKSVEWEPQTGDTFKKKGTTSPTYHLCSKREDGITFGFVENREVGIAGGEITIFALKSDYELVERLKPIEDVVEEELNKALQTKGEQKPAWSEEDEKMLVEIVNDLQVCKSRDISRAAKDAYQKEIDWLKSLKERCNWKPSDEQLEALEHSLGDYNITIFEDRLEMLKSLYQDLKKLKGE